jgi:shikimate dehydrogenase
MDRYVVIGNPVSHSLSPTIHAQFAELVGEKVDYSTLPAPLGQFAQSARAFFDAGGQGANVTLPFKVEAFDLAATRSDRAEAAGAANFLAAREGGLHADNTDGAGLVRDLEENLGFRIRGSGILVLGAGGAARGVIAPLLEREPASLVIANRTLRTATELAARFGASRVGAVALDEIPRGRFDLVVNATSTSTRGEPLLLVPHAIARGALAYDMAYGAAARPFLDRARAAGARTSDGLGMLVEQAAESYFLWRGRRPPTVPVLERLRSRVA